MGGPPPLDNDNTIAHGEGVRSKGAAQKEMRSKPLKVDIRKLCGMQQSLFSTFHINYDEKLKLNCANKNNIFVSGEDDNTNQATMSKKFKVGE